MIGTSFGLSADTIRIAGSRILFDDYAVYAPNKSALTVGGEVSLADFGRMTADLARGPRISSSSTWPAKAGTAVYGKAYLDLGATAKGPVDELVVRGNVALLGGTDINYVMQDSPMDVKERPQNVVTFVSFSELDTQTPDDTPQEVRIGGMDVLINVDINNDVQAAVDLSADRRSRIDLRGGGNLTYTMNPLGDVRLSGKYVLSGGSVRYNPPVISQKIFKITPDSYVEWIGDIADPAFNITAVETVRANVSSDGQDSRPVNFDISINIRNSLNDLAISFGLAAPEDLAMQNQLNSLTAEQRANQAMNLLIYNTYTGPGTTAKVSSENPLNTFIQKELNQWAQNNLKGVDLSFGIDSHGEDDPNGQRTDYSYRLSKNLFNNPRAGGHRRQVQHRRRPVAEPQGEPDRRHFAGIHAHQTRQHVPESLPPHGLREHPRRRDHRNGRGFRHPQETVAAGRPVQADASQNQKTEKMSPRRIRNIVLPLCAVLLAASCSTTRRLGSDEVLYTGVKKILIEPDSGVVLTPAAESAVKEPLSVAPNNPLYSPYLRTPLPVGLWAYNHLYTPKEKGFKYWFYKRLAKQPVLISRYSRSCARRSPSRSSKITGTSAPAPPTPCSTASAAARRKSGTRSASHPHGTIRPSPIRRPSGGLKQLIDSLQATSLLARRGAVQPRLAHARTQTHLPAAPQPGLLLFPSRIHGVPGRHDRRPTAGRPAPEPPAERSAGGPHALPRGRRHGPPDQHQTRPCGYAAPAGRDRHRPAAAENPPRVLSRALTLRPGQLFTVDAQNRTQTDLNKLGIFRSVNLSVTPLDSLRGSDTLDVEIDARFDYPLEAALRPTSLRSRTASSARASPSGSATTTSSAAARSSP